MILFWATLLSTKGSPRHRNSGKPFFLAMLVTVVTVPPIVLLRPVPFDPGWIVSLVYLSVCVGTVVTLAWTAIRWKDQPERFRGAHLRVLGSLLTAFGAVVLVAGLLKGRSRGGGAFVGRPGLRASHDPLRAVAIVLAPAVVAQLARECGLRALHGRARHTRLLVASVGGT